MGMEFDPLTALTATGVAGYHRRQCGAQRFRLIERANPHHRLDRRDADCRRLGHGFPWPATGQSEMRSGRVLPAAAAAFLLHSLEAADAVEDSR